MYMYVRRRKERNGEGSRQANIDNPESKLSLASVNQMTELWATAHASLSIVRLVSRSVQVGQFIVNQGGLRTKERRPKEQRTKRTKK